MRRRMSGGRSQGSQYRPVSEISNWISHQTAEREDTVLRAARLTVAGRDVRNDEITDDGRARAER